MRLIDADFLKEWVDEYLSVFKKYDKGTIKGFVDHAPSIDIEPKRGGWKRKIVDNGFNADWACSECGYRIKTDFIDYNFCPNCGADMREREGE